MKLIILNQDDGEFKEFLGWLKKVTGSFVLKQDYQEISLYVREKDLKRKEIPALQETLDKMISETAVSWQLPPGDTGGFLLSLYKNKFMLYNSK